jgi:hypothetical protein
MSNTLKDVASSTLHTMAHLVDDAQAHLENLPLLHHGAPWWRSKWTIAGAVVTLVAAGWTMRRRAAHRRAAKPSSTGTYERDAAARAASVLVDYDMARS